VQLFTGGMPEGSFVDFSDNGTHPVFACCWIDGKRGASAYVSFPSDGGPGVFRLSLGLRDGDPAKLKVQMSMRMRDDETGNRRTIPLCCSCASLEPMLRGEADKFQMPDQFHEDRFARVEMRIANAHEFTANPLQLRASALERIPEHNKCVTGISEFIAANNAKNETKFAKGTEGMSDGSSRYFLILLSLMLGTPAYTLLPLLAQP